MTSHREFELLVSRIEAALAPAGAAIQSPDHILDRVTGEKREVDASIRYRVGSADLLITVECRDRTRTEDVTWIEQLATKQRQIGAAHTIAVSSTGFSGPASKAARMHGISTRVIDEVSDARSSTGLTDSKSRRSTLHVASGTSIWWKSLRA